MTIIVAKKFKDRIEMASDSRTTRGHFSYISLSPKIKSFGTDCHIGFAGTVSHIKQLTMVFKKSTNFSSIEELDELLDGFHDKELDVSMVIIKGDKLYQVAMCGDDGFLSHEIEDFATVGSGDEYAKVAHEFCDDVVKIVKTVCQFDIYCGGKINKKTIKLGK